MSQVPGISGKTQHPTVYLMYYLPSFKISLAYIIFLTQRYFDLKISAQVTSCLKSVRRGDLTLSQLSSPNIMFDTDNVGPPVKPPRKYQVLEMSQSLGNEIKVDLKANIGLLTKENIVM